MQNVRRRVHRENEKDSHNPDHHMDYDGIEILDKADTDLKLKIKELLHILKRKPSLNKQLNSQSDFDIKTIIIQAYPQFRNNAST